MILDVEIIFIFDVSLNIKDNLNLLMINILNSIFIYSNRVDRVNCKIVSRLQNNEKK